MSARKSERACVYDIVLNGEVIYVGMTRDPVSRMSSHRSKGTAPAGSKLVVHKWYSTREKAFAEERIRMLELEPVKSFVEKDWEAIKRSVMQGEADTAEAEIDEWIERAKKSSLYNNMKCIFRQGYDTAGIHR